MKVFESRKARILGKVATCTFVYAVAAACSAQQENTIRSQEGAVKETAAAAGPGEAGKKRLAMVKIGGRWQKGMIEEFGEDVLFNGHYLVPRFNVLPIAEGSSKDGELGLVGYGTANMLDRSYLWPGGRIPYHLPPDLDARAKNAFLKGIKEVNDKTVIRFEPKTDSDQLFVNVKVLNDPNYFPLASADMGNVYNINEKNEKVNVNRFFFNAKYLDDARLPGVVVHELMHNAGKAHEFDRRDIENYVQMEKENLNPAFDVDTKKRLFPCYFDPSGGDCVYSHAYGKFDLNSIMMYNSYSPAASPSGKPYLYRMHNGEKRFDLGSAGRLSGADIRSLAYLYLGVPGINPPLISKLDPSNPDKHEELEDLQVKRGGWQTVSVDFKTVNVSDCSTHVEAKLYGVENPAEKHEMKVVKKDTTGQSCNLNFTAPSTSGYYTVALEIFEKAEEKTERKCEWKGPPGRRFYQCDNVKTLQRSGRRSRADFLLTVGDPSQAPEIALHPTNLSKRGLFFPPGLKAWQPIPNFAVGIKDDPGDTREVRVVGGKDKEKFFGMSGTVFTLVDLNEAQYEVVLQVLDRKSNKSNELPVTLYSSNSICTQEISNKVHTNTNDLNKSFRDTIEPPIRDKMSTIRREVEQSVKSGQGSDNSRSLEELNSQLIALKELDDPVHPVRLQQRGLGNLSVLMGKGFFDYTVDDGRKFSQSDIDDRLKKVAAKHNKMLKLLSAFEKILVRFEGQENFDKRISSVKNRRDVEVEEAKSELDAYLTLYSENFTKWDEDFERSVEETRKANEEIGAKREALKKEIERVENGAQSTSMVGNVGTDDIESAVANALQVHREYQALKEKYDEERKKLDVAIKEYEEKKLREGNCLLLREWEDEDPCWVENTFVCGM